MNRTMTLHVTLALGAMTASVALAADLGVPARKLILMSRTAPANKAVYVAKMDLGLQKGAAGDPSLLGGTFAWFYTDTPSSVGGAFTMPAALWTTNSLAIAKFVNPQGISCLGGTCIKVAKVKPGILAVVKTAAFEGDGPGNLADGPPSDSGGITTVLTITNGNDASVHRMCTKFAVDSGSTISYTEFVPGIEVKLVAKNGVPVACP